MLSYLDKRRIENEMVRIINQNPSGIDTRVLIGQVLYNLRTLVPRANRYHAAGMIAWVLNAYNYSLIIRTPGYSVIA